MEDRRTGMDVVCQIYTVSHQLLWLVQHPAPILTFWSSPMGQCWNSVAGRSLRARHLEDWSKRWRIRLLSFNLAHTPVFLPAAVSVAMREDPGLQSPLMLQNATGPVPHQVSHIWFFFSGCTNHPHRWKSASHKIHTGSIILPLLQLDDPSQGKLYNVCLQAKINLFSLVMHQ